MNMEPILIAKHGVDTKTPHSGKDYWDTPKGRKRMKKKERRIIRAMENMRMCSCIDLREMDDFCC